MSKSALLYLEFFLIGFGLTLKQVDKIMEILK